MHTLSTDTALAAFLSACVLLTAGCELLGAERSQAALDDRALFATSFESEDDVARWEGELRVRDDDVPEGGGHRSVFVSGGCIHPHVWRPLRASREGSIRMRVWGKNLLAGGYVALRNTRTDEELGLAIQDAVWTHYESKEAVRVRPGDSLTLSMAAGGFVASAMLVDRLEVVFIAEE